MADNRRLGLLFRILLLVIGIPLVLYTFVAVAYFVAFLYSCMPVQNPSRYGEVRNGVRGDFAQHLPRRLPSAAKNVHLYYKPGFAYRGDVTLRYELPARDIHALEIKYAGPAKTVQSIEHAKGLMPNSYGVASTRKHVRLPSGFRIIFLNKFHDSGIAINPSTDEVLYWAGG